MEKTEIRAISTAKKFGGVAADYVPIHAWLDETSTWVEGEKHMAFRHHTQGIFEAEKRFGYTISNSLGKNIPTRTICELHITEDLGFIPTAQEWIESIKLNKWMGFRDKEVIKALKNVNRGVV